MIQWLTKLFWGVVLLVLCVEFICVAPARADANTSSIDLLRRPATRSLSVWELQLTS